MNTIKNNKKVITLSTLSLVLIISLAIIIINLSGGDSNNIQAAGNADETSDTPISTTTPLETTSAPVTTTPMTTTTSETTTVPQTTTSTTTTTPESTTAAKPETTPKVTEITLAPVEVPDDSVMSILEENDIDIVETNPVVQTAPPTNGMPEGAQGTNKYGWYYKNVDGKTYVWSNIAGWIEDSGPGEVEIMDVESNGNSYDGY